MLLFLHIPKTAGTSLRVALYQEFGPRMMPVPYEAGNPHKPAHYPWRDSTSPGDDNRRFDAAAARQFACVAGHYDWGVREKLPEARVVTLLRDPVERVISRYRHLRRHIKNIPGPTGWNRGFFDRAVRPDFGLEEFLKLPDVCNVQTRILAGTLWSDPRPATEPMLSAAKANLAACAAFGLVEEFPQAVARINRAFGLRLPARFENAAPERPDQDAGITPRQREKIMQRNGLDHLLYVFARTLLAQRDQPSIGAG
jgi:hypothetical protein